MAFNPFQSFRKYQKFWMATILLVCMITFVLCTGVGGDLSERLLNLFRGRSGKVYAKLDGRSIYQEDFDRLKSQRAMVNEFMHEALKVDLAQIDRFAKDENIKLDDRHRQLMLIRLGAIKDDLAVRKSRKNYFETGTKLEELVDFMIWQKLADKLEVSLEDKTIYNYPNPDRPIPGLFQQEVFARVPLGDTAIPLFTPSDFRHIQFELRHKYPNITEQAIIKALRDEYRVRIAQLAYLQSQPGTYRYRVGNNRRMLAAMQELKFLKWKSMNMDYYEETRIPLTPAQMWDMYKDKRSQYDVALLPVRVDRFLDKIPMPDKAELLAFFEKYKKVPFDPAAPQPGFEIPAKVKVEWIMADPESPFYKESAKAISLLEMTPPLVWSPFFPHLGAAAGLGGNPLAWNASMERNYEFIKKGPRGERYQAAPLTEPAMLSLLGYLGQRPLDPDLIKAKNLAVALAASMVGQGAGMDIPGGIPLSYAGYVYPPNQKKIDELLVVENKPRARLMGSLVGLGYLSPFTFLQAWNQAGRQEQFLPLALVAEELREQRERKLAGAWVNANMIEVKDRLDSLPPGKEKALRQKVDPLIRQYGLTHRFTSDFVDRFNIAKAPELAELNKAFEDYRHLVNNPEGRQDATEKLREGDLYKLFFTGESFAAGKFVAKPWPPVVEIKAPEPNAPPKFVSLFDRAERPFLFWKIDEKPSRAPEKLEEVKDQVITAWKMEKAREKFALALAKEIAERLEKSGGEILPDLQAEAKKLGSEYIYLPKLANLYPIEDRVRLYRDYPLPPPPLPKDTFPFPREDMLKQLLAVTTMEKPLVIDFKALDDPNKKLHDSFKKHPEVGKKIQILTNLPQNRFYVAAVVASPGAEMADFARAYKRATGDPLDALVDTFQDDAAKEFRQAFITAQRAAMNYQPEFKDEERKSFDAN